MASTNIPNSTSLHHHICPLGINYKLTKLHCTFLWPSVDQFFKKDTEPNQPSAGRDSDGPKRCVSEVPLHWWWIFTRRVALMTLGCMAWRLFSGKVKALRKTLRESSWSRAGLSLGMNFVRRLLGECVGSMEFCWRRKLLYLNNIFKWF